MSSIALPLEVPWPGLLARSLERTELVLDQKSRPLAIKTSAEWFAHFATNAKVQCDIPWGQGAELTEQERSNIANSLQAWQLGETSDGSHLLAAAQQYANRIRDPEFVDAVRLFIKEEQRHGNLLGRFLDLAGIPRIRKNWGDTAFRAIRYSVPSMEMWVTPVVMVETHALIYYNGIRRATNSKVLRCICGQILSDEVAHIRFQCERLAILHRNRPRWLQLLTLAVHRLLFCGITTAVWIGHRRALRAGGYTFLGFWRAAWNRMNLAWRMMRELSGQT